MDFFAAQDRAARMTTVLVIAYLLSIVVVVLATDGAISIFAVLAMTHAPWNFAQIYENVFPYVAVVVTIVILVASLMKAKELQGGGTAFGNLLGGRWMAEYPTDLQEIRLKNVVEEMALAASVKPPHVCILDNEPGINAFAAGASNKDPIIGITSGCLSALNREELQAVIAHEFSHILHNDTVLNTRAYALIYGLLAISVIGTKIISVEARGAGTRSSAQHSGNGFIFIFLLGLMLIIIGSIGALVGRIVRAAIVRQREFLADASAVQYTRSADSVASALYKMGSTGSKLNHPTGEEAEHFLFGAGSGGTWTAVPPTRTHPPTSARIQAILPGFQPSGTTVLPLSKLDEPNGNLSASIGVFAKTGTGKDPNSVVFLGTLPAGSSISVLNAALRNQTVIVLKPNENAHGLPTFTLADILNNSVSAGAAAAVTAANAGEPNNSPIPAPQSKITPPTPPDSVLSNLPTNLRRDAQTLDSAAALTFALAISHLPDQDWKSDELCSISALFGEKVRLYSPTIKPMSVTSRMALLDILVPTLQLSPDDEAKQVQAAISTSVSQAGQSDIIAMGVTWRLIRYLKLDLPTGSPAVSWSDGAVHIGRLVATMVRIQYGTGVMADRAYDSTAKFVALLGPMPTLKDIGSFHSSAFYNATVVLAHASEKTRYLVVNAVSSTVAREPIGVPLADLALRIICDAADHDVPDIFDRWV